MAERRMFAKSIIDSDAFLEMPLSAQALYFHLGMRADDEGFVGNPKKIQKMTGASDDDCKLLIIKNFILALDSGIVVIRHWWLHNYIQSDRFKPTIYEEEKEVLKIDKQKMYTKCIQNVYRMDTQDRLGKDSIGKDSINILPKGNNMLVSKNETNLDYSKFLNYFNTYSKLKSITAITDKRKTHLNARLKEFGVDSFKTVIDNCSKSLFLQGQNKKGWMATFDWLILPNNYVKVLEGNYNSQENELYNELDRRAKAVESNLELKSFDDFETHEVELYDPKGITHN